MRRCIEGDGCRAQGAGQGGERAKKEERRGSRGKKKRKKKKEERKGKKERLSFLGFWLLTTDH
jgi:hypothetical protein